MNILDIRSHDWNQTLLDSIAPNLKHKLGDPIPSADEVKNIINSINSYKFEEAPNGYESSMSMASK